MSSCPAAILNSGEERKAKGEQRSKRQLIRRTIATIPSGSVWARSWHFFC
jgi:hypothetical protein